MLLDKYIYAHKLRVPTPPDFSRSIALGPNANALVKQYVETPIRLMGLNIDRSMLSFISKLVGKLGRRNYLVTIDSALRKLLFPTVVVDIEPVHAGVIFELIVSKYNPMVIEPQPRLQEPEAFALPKEDYRLFDNCLRTH